MTSANKKNLIISAWEKTAARRGADPAVYSTSGGVLRTFVEIEEGALRFEDEAGIFEPGSVVAVQIGNSPDWPSILLALMRRGAVPLPMGRHVEKAELALALETCRVGGMIGQSGGGEPEFRRLSKPASGEAPGCDFLKLTFGTGPGPRAIRFQAGQLLADCANICDTMGITEDDLNFGVVPFSHSYGFSSLITPLLCRGVPLVASDDRMPRAILTDLARTGATVFPGMPVFYQAFAGMQQIPPMPRLRLWISAGAPLGREIAEQFTQKFGLRIHTFYGASECGGIGYDDSDGPGYEDAFLGRPMRGVRVDFCGPSRIEIRSGAVCDGYYPVDAPERAGCGRFRPFDLVKQTERGMSLAGSVSDVINIAGRKLNPREVEAILLRIPGVRQAAVFGVPSVLRNEDPVACLAGEIDPGRISLQAQEVLGAWQMPREFWVVDTLPGIGGEPDRRELARLYLAHKAARGARG